MNGSERVLILDFGAQYGQLIARRVREAKVYCEIVPHGMSSLEVRRLAPRGIILTGGPASVYSENAPYPDPGIFGLGIPVMGICYGMQLMAHMLGGRVRRADKREYGKAAVQVTGDSELFRGMPGSLQAWMSHGDLVEELPPGFRAIASTANTPVAAMADEARRLYGVQFHPEVVHTPLGLEVLKNFLYRICGLDATWTPGSFIAEAVERIRAEVGGRRAICGLSGGVDSAVAAVLVHRAIGDRLTCIFVDHGLLRKNEGEQVATVFRQELDIPLVYVDAADRFLARLAGVTDPEEKRKAVGEEFIRVFEEEAARLGEVDYLVQGTLYPDVIESGSINASVIKSHHNVGGLPERMNLKLIEPLRLLFKDEVRAVGAELGLPDEIVWRHPFPGPGLAVRVIGEVSRERLDILREADAIVLDEIRKAGLYRDIWQCFAVLPAMKSVGVMGDERTYSYTIALRAVTSEDGMTADWARIPYEVLERISGRVVNEVPHVNRVVYDITSKPPATIEWE